MDGAPNVLSAENGVHSPPYCCLYCFLTQRALESTPRHTTFSYTKHSMLFVGLIVFVFKLLRCARDGFLKQRHPSPAFKGHPPYAQNVGLSISGICHRVARTMKERHVGGTDGGQGLGNSTKTNRTAGEHQGKEGWQQHAPVHHLSAPGGLAPLHSLCLSAICAHPLTRHQNTSVVRAAKPQRVAPAEDCRGKHVQVPPRRAMSTTGAGAEVWRKAWLTIRTPKRNSSRQPGAAAAPAGQALRALKKTTKTDEAGVALATGSIRASDVIMMMS